MTIKVQQVQLKPMEAWSRSNGTKHIDPLEIFNKLKGNKLKGYLVNTLRLHLGFIRNKSQYDVQFYQNETDY
jgi:hypothetical protein